MIRPKHPSFIYSDRDIQRMIENINFCKGLGVDGVVLGCLNEDSNFNMKQINLLSEIAKPLNVIIHKAIDNTDSVLNSLLLLLKNKNINGILTSGGKTFAIDAIENLKKMLDLAPDNFEIISAGGITHKNIDELHSLIQGKYYHGKSIIKLK